MANYANQKRMEILNAELLEHKKDAETDGYYYPMDYKYIDIAASNCVPMIIIVRAI